MGRLFYSHLFPSALIHLLFFPLHNSDLTSSSSFLHGIVGASFTLLLLRASVLLPSSNRAGMRDGRCQILRQRYHPPVPAVLHCNLCDGKYDMFRYLLWGVKCHPFVSKVPAEHQQSIIRTTHRRHRHETPIQYPSPQYPNTLTQSLSNPLHIGL